MGLLLRMVGVVLILVSVLFLESLDLLYRLIILVIGAMLAGWLGTLLAIFILLVIFFKFPPGLRI